MDHQDRTLLSSSGWLTQVSYPAGPSRFRRGLEKRHSFSCPAPSWTLKSGSTSAAFAAHCGPLQSWPPPTSRIHSFSEKQQPTFPRWSRRLARGDGTMIASRPSSCGSLVLPRRWEAVWPPPSRWLRAGLAARRAGNDLLSSGVMETGPALVDY